jgi:hypothetical protein
MTTVVQTNYRPQIRPGVPGMIADMTDAERQTYQSETSGLGFGLAVSNGTGPSGCVLGGTKFLGITCRDTTIVPGGISIDPLFTGAALAPDLIQLNANLSVLTRGRIWVIAGAKVSVGDALWYNNTTGALTNATGGVAAQGSITFTVNPVDGNTVVIDGTTVTFKATGASGNQVNIGPTLGDTVAALANLVNAGGAAGTDPNLTLLNAEAYPPSPGGSGQGSGANQLLLSAKALGTGGNAYTLGAGTTPGVTISGTVFSGGVGGTSTQVPSGYWVTPSLVAGDVATVSLAIQR